MSYLRKQVSLTLKAIAADIKDMTAEIEEAKYRQRKLQALELSLLDDSVKSDEMDELVFLLRTTSTI